MRWTVVDFVLVVLGGLAGSLVTGLAAGLIVDNTAALLFITFTGQFLGHLAVLWLIARSRGLGADSLGFDLRPTDGLYLGLGIVLQIALALLFEPLRQILVPDDGLSQDVTRIFSQLSSPTARIAMVATTTLVAPLVEELMFRGVLLRALKDRSRTAILIVTSVVFALFHVAGTSSPRAAILIFFQIFAVGLVLAHLTLREDRLGPSIFLHAGFNLLTVVVLLLPPEVLEQLQQGSG